MGKITTDLSDVVIFTEDNNRSENVEDIMSAVEDGRIQRGYSRWYDIDSTVEELDIFCSKADFVNASCNDAIWSLPSLFLGAGSSAGKSASILYHCFGTSSDDNSIL